MPSKLTTFVLALAIALVAIISPATAQTKPEAMKHFRRGFELAMEKKYEEALEAYRKGVETDPKVNRFASYNQEQNAKFYERAWSIRNKDVREAIRLLRDLTISEPSVPKAFNELGAIYFKLGNEQIGREYSMKALRIAPNYAPTVGNLGFYLTKTGHQNEAAFWLEAYLLLDPNTSHQKTATRMLKAIRTGQ